KKIKTIIEKVIIVLGGPHPTIFAEEVLKESDADICVIGEGEETFLELVTVLNFKGDLTKVKGIVFKKEGNIIRTEKRKLIENLDKIPFPDRDIIKLNLYYPPPTKRVSNYNATSLVTSRGCVFHCTYCIATKIWEHKVRFRSVENVISEIEMCVNKYGIAEFNIHDEWFTINKNRTIELCKKIIEKKLKIAWICMGRVHPLDEELLSWMKKAGCKKINFGFESGDQKILDNIKHQTTLEQGLRAAKLCHKVGIKIGANFMIGAIGETLETIKNTIKYAKKIKPDTVAFFAATPYPGTEFYEEAKRLKYLREDIKWQDFTLVSNSLPVVNLPDLSAKEIKEQIKKAYKKFYLRPNYITNKILKIRSFIELKNLIEGIKIFFRVK
ncbi:MAG TPA: radical SAM protein, partial [bacterium]|nr:radical SAM protein [bacterium]